MFLLKLKEVKGDSRSAPLELKAKCLFRAYHTIGIYLHLSPFISQISSP